MTMNLTRRLLKTHVFVVYALPAFALGFVFSSDLQAEVPAESRVERSVPLSGQSNFRDLGGYTTIDGRRVRKGILYRSGELQKLTDDDVKILKKLGIKTVVNFLTPEEIKKRGRDRLPGHRRRVE